MPIRRSNASSVPLLLNPHLTQNPQRVASTISILEQPVASVRGWRKGAVICLGLSALLKDPVSSTHSIESAFAMVQDTTRNVKRWRNGKQVMRRSAATLLQAEHRFHRVRGYRDIPLLTMKLRQHLQAVNREAVNAG